MSSSASRLRCGPTFVVAGAGRAGTTALIEGLRRHPGVFVTDPKEPHYFAMHGTRPTFRGPGDDRFVNDLAVTRMQDYLELYPSGSSYVARGEGSVSTMYYHRRAIPEMLRINADLRVVLLLREPVDRAYSSFQYLRGSGREPLADFLAAVEEEPSRRADHWHHLWHYTEMSKYAEAVQSLLMGLPPDHVGVWFYDELDSDYAGTVSSVLRFLGVSPLEGTGVLEGRRVNASGSPRSPRSARAQQVITWTSGRPVLRAAARRMTTWQFREAVRTRLLERNGVPADARRVLQPMFAEDLGKLRALLPDGPFLPAWLRELGEARQV